MEGQIRQWATLQMLMETILHRPRLPIGHLTLSVQMTPTCQRCRGHPASRQMTIARLGRRTVLRGHAGRAHQMGQEVRLQPLLLDGAVVVQIMEEDLTTRKYRRQARALGVALPRVVKL